ncbi:hypothetical protein LXL04_003244 [Taraxacum kok-saghyz]
MEMSNMTSSSEDRMTSKDSPSFEEASTERTMVGRGSLKKGPWTAAEDAILMEYVNQNGEGNWNAVQKHSGLSRCGKSCRLRWTNHLRPDLKKGAFTPEEERLIIELHAKMGNKWARMAVELPGRTDNEIKNFWNTRTKRKQRAGLPIYPHDISFHQVQDTPSQNQNIPIFPNEIFPPTTTNIQIPAINFKDFKLNHENLYQIPPESFLDIMTTYPPKIIRPSGGGGGGGGGLGDVLTGMNNQYEDVKMGEPMSLNPSSLYAGSHALMNGNNCSSFEPNLWAMKNELPSLQYVHGGPPSVIQSDSYLHRNSGLLEDVLHESETLKVSKPEKDHHHNHMNMNMNVDENIVWDGYGDPISPLTHSTASVFSEYTPISGSPMDEHLSLEATSVKREVGESDEMWNEVSCLRPDSLLGLNWFSGNPTNENDDDMFTICKSLN